MPSGSEIAQIATVVALLRIDLRPWITPMQVVAPEYGTPGAIFRSCSRPACDAVGEGASEGASGASEGESGGGGGAGEDAGEGEGATGAGGGADEGGGAGDGEGEREAGVWVRMRVGVQLRAASCEPRGRGWKS